MSTPDELRVDRACIDAAKDGPWIARACKRYPALVADVEALQAQRDMLINAAHVAGGIAFNAQNTMAYELAKSFLAILNRETK